jgi:DNA (cytosine-5)-methyltransferase 1
MRPLTYIDLFAGCGGLSLGLQQAGWEGLFAIEHNPMAFETLSHNLIESTPDHFPNWPAWLSKKPCSIQALTDRYADQLLSLRGQVMLVAGGPPCQGFSSAGRRQKNDHRNKLYRSYLEVVELVRPAMVLLENVKGIKMHFGPRPGKKKRGPGRPPTPYSERIKASLGQLGYKVFDAEVLASEFGVPQSRTRFVAVGLDTNQFNLCPIKSPFDVLQQVRSFMLAGKKLPADRPISARDAISDLEYAAKLVMPSPDTKGFMAGLYAHPTSTYQLLMRGDTKDGAIADSHRFVNHRAHIVARFRKILAECVRGKNLNDDFRKANNLKKACVVPLDPERPAVTLTTIPDDMIHYSQPRVLTVRECARLQSFPDWFQFRSKYTTGGDRRMVECPRYTQVGNAVPPLLAEALGRALKEWISTAHQSNPQNGQSAA